MLVLTFQVGHNRLALDLRQIREVVPCVKLQALAGGPRWMAGLLVYRGLVVPVVDLHHLLDAGECPRHLSSRIILVPHPGQPDRLLGLLAAQVAEIRTVNPPQEALPSLLSPDKPDLGPIIVEERGLLHLLDLDRLLPDAVQDRLALAAPGGLSCRPS